MKTATKVKKESKAKKKIVTGYKVFDPDFKCRDFQYEVGKTYKHKGDIELCSQGFHFCQDLNNCFEYYSFDPKNRIAIVETSGKVIHGDDKSVSNEITIIKEITWGDMLNIVNSGVGNTGRKNAGNYNAGNENAGKYNAGNYNAGNYNAGNYNAGNENAGYKNAGKYNAGNENAGKYNAGNYNAGNENAGKYNAGNYNAGKYNAGNYNAGYKNAGDFNSGSHCVGAFNTEKEAKIKIFDKESDWTMQQWRDSEAYSILSRISFTEYVWFSSMTAEEKKKYPYAETTKGYVKYLDYKDAWGNFWNNLTDSRKKIIKAIPNFDPEKFKSITGVEV